MAGFPSTIQDMVRALGSRELAEAIAADVPPIEVLGTLIPDPDTPSRYRWTLGLGPPIGLDAELLC